MIDKQVPAGILGITQGNGFLFSVVIPVYNTERYVAEAIESILAQTIGFEKHIQMIIINDGSTDNSATVCRAYQAEFPNNIVFVDKEHEGVSIARRVGLEHATGVYVNFLDSDDYWSEDAFQCAADFFAQNQYIKIVAARHTMFGLDGLRDHPLIFKYDVDCIVDIRKRIDYSQLSLSNTFVSRELFNPVLFDSALVVAEDFFTINEILLRELRYGIISRPNYYYRKREDASSALDSSKTNVSWYLSSPKYCHKRLFDLSMQYFGEVIPYIQYCVMYDLQWRIGESPPEFLTDDEYRQYICSLIGLLQKIDDEIIISQREASRSRLLYALMLKYGLKAKSIQNNLRVIGGNVYWESPVLGRLVHFYSLKKDAVLGIESISARGDKLLLEGRLYTLLPIDKVAVTAKTLTEKKSYLAHVEHNPLFQVSGIEGKVYYIPLKFDLEMPAESFSLHVMLGEEQLKARCSFGKDIFLGKTESQYIVIGKYIIVSSSPYSLFEVMPLTRKTLLKREAIFELRAIANQTEDRFSIKRQRKNVKTLLRKLTRIVRGL